MLYFAFCISNLFSQFNIKIAYNAQYASLNKTNNFFQDFNKLNANITQQYSNFHFMHGLELGVRYMLTERVGLEGNFGSLFSSDNQLGQNINGSIINDEWRMSNRLITIGFENYYNTFGFGVHIGYSKWKYLKDFPGASKKLEIFGESIFNAKITCFIYVKTGKNSFALKPYYNFPLDELDISKVDNVLNNRNTTGVNENFKNFGLSVVFYNGPQRN